MKVSKKIRFGVIGTNIITEQFIEAASQCEHFELSAIYSRTSERGQLFASKYHVKHVFTDLEELLTSDVVDAMYIASPNAMHAKQAILCLNHQKHVLCEKPLASNLSEVQAMITAAKKNNVVLMEAMKTTLFPNFNTIKKHLDKIGTVRRYFASFCQYSSRYDAYREGII
ncbi:MAG: Gfo/Idh/MocA family oxidoreductase, partial [Turicibacter sp.]|nr:Gfo/Idh/MocA family oxidoreductase [Turicibacter sp.]